MEKVILLGMFFGIAGIVLAAIFSRPLPPKCTDLDDPY